MGKSIKNLESHQARCELASRRARVLQTTNQQQRMSCHAMPAARALHVLDLCYSPFF
jgi:hypothetical protein